MLFRTRSEMKRGLGLHFSNTPGDGGAGSGGSGGGAGSGGSGDPGAGKGDAGQGDLAAQLAALKAENERLKAASGKVGQSGDDPDLGEKARREREAADKDSARTKKLESSIKFNLSSKEFLKQNESLLPKEVTDIFSQAEKETFADAIEKDSAIKSGLIQAFFQVQANVDLLTPGQKAQLDSYLKLTKNGKQDKAQEMYDMIFEPAFEMLKRVKRAEALGKGYGGGTDADTAYKNKMMSLSKKHYLGEKSS
jgi:hypothetical protein